MIVPFVTVRPQARNDLIQCFAYLGERNPGAARRFRQAAEITYTALGRNPGMGTPYEVSNPRLDWSRCFRVERFKNYLIFYLPIPGGIDIIRVLHAARDIGAILETEG